MGRQLNAGRIAICIFGGMLALAALSMTPAFAAGNNCPPGDPACNPGTGGGGGKRVMAVHHGHITPSGSHIKGFSFTAPHLAPPHMH